MKKGFTLIELLIVVAIIAILAAIAVPNFLEAQTRSKVTRSKADLRNIATALESYTIDNNKVMTERCLGGSAINGRSAIYASNTSPSCVSCRFKRLTTPIAYISSIPPEVFVGPGGFSMTIGGAPDFQYDTFDYFSDTFDPNNRAAGLTSGATWRVSTAGPDKIQAAGGSEVGSPNNRYGVDYDPTNGTISNGDIVRVSGAAGKINTIQPAINRVAYKYNVTGL